MKETLYFLYFLNKTVTIMVKTNNK